MVAPVWLHMCTLIFENCIKRKRVIKVSEMSDTCPTMQPLGSRSKSQHNKKYYDSHKPQCYRKSLIYDIRKIGRIPKKEIMQRYGLSLGEFINIFTVWASARKVPLTQEKKEQLSKLVVQYF